MKVSNVLKTSLFSFRFFKGEILETLLDRGFKALPPGTWLADAETIDECLDRERDVQLNHFNSRLDHRQFPGDEGYIYWHDRVPDNRWFSLKSKAEEAH